MRGFAFFGLLLAGVPASAEAARSPVPPDTVYAPAPLAADTTVRLHFSIPSRPLGDALSEFSRQAGVLVRLDREAAAAVVSREVSGRYTSAEALRLMLSETGLTARFTEGGATVAIWSGAEELPVYALAPLTVIGAASRGYTTHRTSSATRTDTPLHDTPL
jgi:hypothetical protein